MRRMEGFLLPLSARRRRPFQCNTTCLVKGRRHAGRACLLPCRPVWRGLFLFLPQTALRRRARSRLCAGDPLPPHRPATGAFFAARPLPSCTKTHKKPPWQPSGLPRGLCFACVKKQTCSPLPLCRHGARARPGAASAHFLTRGAFGAARRARLQPAARWRRASASCAASWAYSGLSNRLA